MPDPFQHGTFTGHTSSHAMARHLHENPLAPAPDALQMAEKIHELRLQGQSYATIAKRLEITPSATMRVHGIHLTQLQELDRLGAAAASRRVQDERYETLLAAVWTQALDGDLAAIKECRAILDSISNREFKVTAMIEQHDGDTRRTLIAEGSTEQYIEALKEMSL
jgi:predicted transcriptional regulator